ncbi:hypothetical protein HII17_16595 [Thalassotalea sp. M1531]|uniref:Uncharacterized protein n=1 Tax=Thalassotalea algicola TaxID=2716224 RepID=A0A7Y0LER3_9GAMM|nr:hypothetical protein [Thalassotalea algicola]NMP33180.1 hypothetical protein [Thalassotalea algicola]
MEINLAEAWQKLGIKEDKEINDLLECSNAEAQDTLNLITYNDNLSPTLRASIKQYLTPVE